MQRLGKIKNVEGKIHAKARKMLQHGEADYAGQIGVSLFEVCKTLAKVVGV